ncbi:unnamed protein product [Paramecium octaurelia]|uniref:Uncharacterized protein n=1 Tax=Paramecium octaurelia TaxID=43137 RepID=A0A8S1W4C2_PAROT|nr:unnamed protein product [Paramecium octaurelia]
MHGKTGEKIFSLKQSIVVITQQKIIKVTIEMQNLPTKMNAPPIPLTKENLILLAHIVSKAALAAEQKFLPVRAIIMQALLFKNLMNLSKHAMQQLKHLNKHLTALFSEPATFSVQYLIYSNMILMSYTIAKIKEPNAKEPA